MRFLLEPEPTTDLDALTETARAAHACGLDGVLLRQSPALASPLMAASALAARVGEIRLAVEVDVGDRHPFELAEEVAVVDLTSGGRLLVVARPAPGAADVYDEALDLLRTALAARPFRFEGRRWRVPALLEQNEHGLDTHVRLMPAPAQWRLEVWGADAGRDAALARSLGYLAEADDDPAELGAAYARSADAFGPAAIGAVRARRERLDTPQDLVVRLRDGREAFGQDCAVVPGGAGAAHVLGTYVGPRVQLNRLPPGLEEHWQSTALVESGGAA
jgi:alkanesulfonate monooxygenase SsuD/methylene tetrahydromethanopterin reductase-like flavin-dependent oxidoreductase (luciferase family)